jgi:hypothetical protein
MERMFFCGIAYSIEFIKLLLLVNQIFQIKVKKRINGLFAVSLIGLIAVSYWLDLSKASIVYALIAFLVFFLALEKKRNILVVITMYIAVSLLDILISLVCIHLFHLTQQQMQDAFLLIPAMNSISLLLIILLAVMMKKKDKNQMPLLTCIPVLITGGFVLSFYLSCVQYVGMGKEYRSYRRGLEFGSIAITVVYALVCILLIVYQSRNTCLQMENHMNQRLLEQQNDYYHMLLRKEKETKMFRHDIRQHLTCIHMLCEQQKYEELEQYLAQMELAAKELSPKISVGNSYIDMILADMMERFPDVTVDWKGKVPQLSMDSMDLCTLFYNLLKNAFESAHSVATKSEVHCNVKIQGTNLMVVVSNAYENLKQDRQQNFLTTKSGQGHGYGLKNIEKCVEKYHGSYRVTTENKMFCTEIILPDMAATI